LLIIGDDAQSGMKRNVMRVTFVGVEQYDSFPPCALALLPSQTNKPASFRLVVRVQRVSGDEGSVPGEVG
jgi:hypothetical protein